MGGGTEDVGAAGPTGDAGGWRAGPEGAPAPAPDAGPHADGERPGGPGPAASAPVNPGAWDARSWVLLDGPEPEPGPFAAPAAPAPQPYGEPPRVHGVVGGRVPPRTAGDATHVPVRTAPAADGPPPADAPTPDAPRVVWPEAGQADDVAPLDAARVPAVEQTGVTKGPRRDRPVVPVPSAAPPSVAADPRPADGPPAEDAVRPDAPGAHDEPHVPDDPAPDAPAPAPEPQAPDGSGRDPRGRVSADPVRALMRQYRELCERAVDPLEIAAGLEARGVTDRTAARFRHRDVFSLAEELYARVPHAESTDGTDHPDGEGGGTSAGPATRARTRTGRAARTRTARRRTAAPSAPSVPAARAAGRPPLRRRVAAALRRAALRVAVPLLPGVLCCAAFAALARPDLPGPARQGVAVLGTVAVLAALWWAVRPLLRDAAHASPVRHGHAYAHEDGHVHGEPPRTPLPVVPALALCALLGYALRGDWLLAELLAGGPHPGDAAPAGTRRSVPIALACAVAPAVWCARWFAARARRRLARSRTLAEFASGVRPLLAVAVAVFAALLLAVECAAGLVADGALPPAGTQAATAALGVLLFVALLLAVHGFARAAVVGTGAACALEALALGAVLAARLPGAEALDVPVARTAGEWGPSAVPALLCAAVALALLAYAARVLTGASAHHVPAAHPVPRAHPVPAAPQGPPAHPTPFAYDGTAAP
ncbi:hypothetical protein [Streptomyces sp. Z26]|uniref:hypothetical protein n=1 Tax=Streptomyces sp. Z26 TaxID=2500177 RepID=UPI000EF16DCC|nr:hypothetical protein [Streptomyces sp. Z26]RLL68785.1 hypothetical protein D7M15_20295 [Streptomyces sp. Z26]